MLDPFIHLLNDQTPLAPWGRFVIIAALFLSAWLVSRAAAMVAGRVLTWHDRRHADVEERRLGEKIAEIKRRETSVAIVRTSIAYVAFSVAAVLSVAQLAGGVDRLAAIAGGVFAVLVAAFIAQRFLIDLIAGFAMFVERWYSVGDTIVHPRRPRAAGRRRGRLAPPHAHPRRDRRGDQRPQLADHRCTKCSPRA